MLTEHIMALHTGKKSGFGFKNSSINSSMNVPEDTLKWVYSSLRWLMFIYCWIIYCNNSNIINWIFHYELSDHVFAWSAAKWISCLLNFCGNTSLTPGNTSIHFSMKKLKRRSTISISIWGSRNIPMIRHRLLLDSSNLSSVSPK